MLPTDEIERIGEKRFLKAVIPFITESLKIITEDDDDLEKLATRFNNNVDKIKDQFRTNYDNIKKKYNVEIYYKKND
jgi:cytochrome c556